MGHSMQDRYAGDIGDYVKLALLRALSPGLRLGVAWYLYPNEDHNADGKHISYLKQPERWRHLDPELFDALGSVITGQRSVTALEQTDVLGKAAFANALVPSKDVHHRQRAAERDRWFADTLDALTGADIVFADPDNGLIDNNPRRRSSAKFGKQLPLSEALSLAAGRTAVIYHHNTRFAGGHDLEVEHWRIQLGARTLAVRANAFSCRTFFVVNASPDGAARTEEFCKRWGEHNVRMHQPTSSS